MVGGPPPYKTSDQFPLADCAGNLAHCCVMVDKAQTLKIRGLEGDALVLHSHGSDGRLETASGHAHCPVKLGELWIAEWRFKFTPHILDEVHAKKPLDPSKAPPPKPQPSVKFEGDGVNANVYWVNTD